MAIELVDTNSEYIDTGDWNVPDLDELTITAWCTPDNFGFDPRIITKSIGTGSDIAWQLAIDDGSPNRARFYLRNASGTNKLITGGTMVSGVEYFMAARYDGSDMYVYLDAAQVATTAMIGNVRQFSAPVFIGASPSAPGVRFFDGVLQDIRVYGRAITLDELQTIYALRGRDNIVNDLVGRWMMNEQAPGVSASGANTIIDLSGQEHHGTPVNTPTYAVSTLEWRRKVS